MAAGPGTIKDLNVGLILIDPFSTFVWPGDLRIRLPHVGTPVVLASNNLGNGFDPLTYVFDDDGGLGTTAPIGVLSAFWRFGFRRPLEVTLLDAVVPNERDRGRVRLVTETGTLALFGGGWLVLALQGAAVRLGRSPPVKLVLDLSS